jgi:uncharacterized membrane protein
MTKRHMFFMLLCCLIPVVGLGAILLFNIPVSTVLYIGLILLCPLSHLLMMKFMIQDEKSSHYDASMRSERGEKQSIRE